MSDECIGGAGDIVATDVSGFDVVDPRYEALHARAVDVLGRDERVAAVEVSGSIGRGTADRWSDLDLEIITQPGSNAAFLEEWPQWLADITPTVFARTPIAPFIINVVTDEGLTFDIAIYEGASPVWPVPTGYPVGQLSGQRFADVGTALEYAVAEQLRGMAGPLISLVQREEHMRHLAAVPHLLGLLTTVFLAETGAPPPGKQWNRTYTEEQRAAVAAIPPAAATRDDMIAFGMGCAELLVTRARPLYPRYNLDWPSELAAVVAARVREELQIETGSWLY